jgi:hypothetical protein
VEDVVGRAKVDIRVVASGDRLTVEIDAFLERREKSGYVFQSEVKQVMSSR